MSTPEEMGIDTTRRNAQPRLLTESERARLDEFTDSIHYSTRYVFLMWALARTPAHNQQLQ